MVAAEGYLAPGTTLLPVPSVLDVLDLPAGHTATVLPVPLRESRRRQAGLLPLSIRWRCASASAVLHLTLGTG